MPPGDSQETPGDAPPEPETVGYNPRPQNLPPEPRVEVEEVARLTGGVKTRVRVMFGTEGASSLSSVFTLCNSAIGAGVLSLPYAFQCAGLIGCFVLCLVVAAMESFTMYVLAKFSERYDANSYGILVRRALGRKTAALLSGVTLIYLWGSTIAYFVIMADTFTSISSSYLGPEAWSSQRPPVLLVTGLLVLLMCFPRDLAALERVSFAAVLGFCYTALAVLIRGTQTVLSKPDPWQGISLFRVDTQALYALSIVVFGFNCHANVVGVFWELEHYPSRLISRLPASPRQFQSLGPLAPKPYTYKLIGMLGAIISAMTVILTGYMSVGMAGYMAYPSKVSSNVLNTFPADDVLLQVARAVIGCVVMGHAPLNHNPARKSWEDLLDAAANVKEVPGWVSHLISVAFVGSTVATAMVVTDLGSVLHMIGGTAASFMIFLLPGLLLMNAAIIKRTSSLVSLSQLAGDEDDDTSYAAGSSVAGGDDVQSTRSVPLLDKKAGIRDSGLIFVSESKSWLAGMLLVVVSGVVLAVTLITAALG